MLWITLQQHPDVMRWAPTLALRLRDQSWLPYAVALALIVGVILASMVGSKRGQS